MAQIIWAPRAVENLTDIVHYIASSAPFTARRFAQRIVARVDQLSYQSNSGSWLPEDDGRTYRQLIEGNYRIIYGFSEPEATVFIVAVHHAAKLLDPRDLP